MPPPVPVPTMTPKTTSAPAAAPSHASDSAKQFASLASRTGRPSARSRSCWSGRPISHVEFAFFTRPGRGRDGPGHADADRAARPRVRLERADQPGDRPHACRRNRPAASRCAGRPRPGRPPSSAMPSIFVPPRSMPIRIMASSAGAVRAPRGPVPRAACYDTWMALQERDFYHRNPGDAARHLHVPALQAAQRVPDSLGDADQEGPPAGRAPTTATAPMFPKLRNYMIRTDDVVDVPHVPPALRGPEPPVARVPRRRPGAGPVRPGRRQLREPLNG